MKRNRKPYEEMTDAEKTEYHARQATHAAMIATMAVAVMIAIMVGNLVWQIANG